MQHFLRERPPWAVVGVSLGLIVVAVQAAINQQVGILGGFSAVVERASGRTSELRWKAWFLFGVVLGGMTWGLLAGRAGSTSYGWLTRTFTGSSAWLTGVVLACAGVLIGYGAKTAGGCTSGNGLVGCAAGSPASLVATATFFGTAIIGSVVLSWIGVA